MRRGEPWFYVQFETLPQERPVRLIEAERARRFTRQALVELAFKRVDAVLVREPVIDHGDLGVTHLDGRGASPTKYGAGNAPNSEAQDEQADKELGDEAAHHSAQGFKHLSPDTGLALFRHHV